MKKIAILALLSFAAVFSIRGQELAPFKSGDRVAFVGNSITDGGHYHSYLWLYYMTRFPNQPLWMMNCGIGGDTSTEILGRLQGDVIDRKPNVILLTYGMNDAGLFQLYSDTAAVFSEHRIAEAKANMLKMEQQLRQLKSTRIVMVGTSPYDETTRFNKDIFPMKADNIRRIVADQKEVAERNNWEFFNFEEQMTAFNRERQQTDSTFTLCGPDRIHPDNDGHMYMAYLVLKAQGLAGKKVADMSVDAKKLRVMASENCEISNLAGTSAGLSLDYLAYALPYPLDTIARGGMEFKRPQSRIVNLLPDFMREMNAELLTVSNLRKGRYELRIDDIVIDKLTHEQLATGINLATYMNTPQMQQARTIMMLNEDRWEMERRLRDWAWVEFDYFKKNGHDDVNSAEARAMYEHDKVGNWWLASRRDIYARTGQPAVRKACERYMQTVVDEIYSMNKPVVHHIVLKMSNEKL